MKICILTPRFPFPENGGDVLRINNICRYLKSKGHLLVLVSYCSTTDIENQHNLPEQIYDKIYYVKRNGVISLINSLAAIIFNKPIQIGYYFSFAYLSIFKKIVKLEQPDLYLAHLLRMVPYLNICRLQDTSIIEMTDALSKTYNMAGKSSGVSLKKIIYMLEEKRIAKYENKTIHNYKKCVLVSEADKEFLEYKSL
ncbi:hypothetical protein AGMMS49928_27060 [Spirochaetia bacterium]|nr:hypothetical protein AGMMS49928_27060 [Spirochaetia bacterium]